MTEEQKQALTGLCKIEIKRWKAASESNPNMRYMVELMEVALAALTAPPVKVDDSMALAFHKALNDGGVGHEDLEEIKVGLEAALCNIPRPAPAADLAELVPDDKAIRKEAGGYAPVYSLQEQQLFIDGATWLRAAILRNIEEAK
jgi:hypothetical protein